MTSSVTPSGIPSSGPITSSDYPSSSPVTCPQYWIDFETFTNGTVLDDDELVDDYGITISAEGPSGTAYHALVVDTGAGGIGNGLIIQDTGATDFKGDGGILTLTFSDGVYMEEIVLAIDLSVEGPSEVSVQVVTCKGETEMLSPTFQTNDGGFGVSTYSTGLGFGASSENYLKQLIVEGEGEVIVTKLEYMLCPGTCTSTTPSALPTDMSFEPTVAPIFAPADSPTKQPTPDSEDTFICVDEAWMSGGNDSEL